MSQSGGADVITSRGTSLKARKSDVAWRWDGIVLVDGVHTLRAGGDGVSVRVAVDNLADGQPGSVGFGAGQGKLEVQCEGIRNIFGQLLVGWQDV